MAIPHTMNNAERRAALIRARKDIETSMYSIAMSVGLDADAMDYSNPSILWQTDVEGVSQIDHLPDEEKRPYVDILNCSINFRKIVEKLEGPNRVVQPCSVKYNYDLLVIGVSMDGDLRKYLEGQAELIEETLDDSAPEETAEPKTKKSALSKAKKATGLLEKAKDNIAWVLGLPAAISGAFGFLWQSSSEEAALDYKVAQLEEAVAELKAENDLLGGGTKNFSLDMSGAPGGSVTVIAVTACLIVFIGFLFWYQSKRKKR